MDTLIELVKLTGGVNELFVCTYNFSKGVELRRNMNHLGCLVRFNYGRSKWHLNELDSLILKRGVKYAG